MIHILPICILFLGISTASAQYEGFSAYAAMSPHFPCDQFLQIESHAKEPAMAVLWGTFGDDTTCIQRFLAKFADRPHALEIHFSDEVCRRNSNCEDGEFFPQFSVAHWSQILASANPYALQAVWDRLSDIRAVVDKYSNSNTQLVLSTGLEDDYSPQAYAILSHVLRAWWPYILIRSPNHGGAVSPALFKESHGSGARCSGSAQIVNPDGSLLSLSESRAFMQANRNCYIALLWNAISQGKTVNNKPVFPRKSRTFIITAADVANYGALLK